MRYTLCQKILNILAFALSSIESKQSFRGFRREEIALRNLRVVLGRLPSKDELRSVFFYHALYHLQLGFAPKKDLNLDDRSWTYIQDMIRIAEEAGAVFVSAHLGLPELVSYFLSKSGIDVFVLVESLRNRAERLFFGLARQRFQINLTTSIRYILKELKEPRGKIFAFLLDRPIPGAESVRIFGRESRISSIPFKISERFGLRVFGFKVVRHKEFIPPLLSPHNFLFSFQMRELENFQDMVSFIEQIIIGHYLQWNPFCIYPFTF